MFWHPDWKGEGRVLIQMPRIQEPSAEGESDGKTAKLQLLWPGKAEFLLMPKDASGRPAWVSRHHPAASEVRLTEFTQAYGEVNESDPHADNLVFAGDSLDVLRILNQVAEYRREYRGRVSLCYIDPPFNTKQTFVHYDDWMEHSTWLSFMHDRLLMIKELLAPNGSVWIHLDSAEVHRMRCLMDEVFGAGAFLNQVVWKRTQGKSSARRGMGTMCDTLLVYGKTDQVALEPVVLPLTGKHLATEYRFSDEGGRYMLGDVTGPGLRSGDSGKPWRGRLPNGRNRHWYAPTVPGVTDGEAALLPTRERLDLLDAAGYINWPEGDDSAPKFKHYLREDSGVVVGDLWDDIPRVPNSSKERVDYDTQKPEALLQRILEMATDPGDIVLDVFAGSGTTAAAAHKMGRRWVAADISRTSIDTYLVPRLCRVVDGEDKAGISQKTTEDPSEDLPDGMIADDFASAAKAVKAVMAGSLLEDSPDLAAVLKQLQRLGRKSRKVEDLWAGGGGFRTVTVGPSMYEQTEYGVMLAGWATNGAFARAVAGQLGFAWQAGPAPFCGVRGRMRLAVLDGAVGHEEVIHIASHLDEAERVTVVAKIILPGADQALTDMSKGSVIRKAPRDLLLGARRRSPRSDGATQ